MATPTPTLEPLPEAYNQLQAQFSNARHQISSLQNDLGQIRTNLGITQAALQNAHNQLTSCSQALDANGPATLQRKRVGNKLDYAHDQ